MGRGIIQGLDLIGRAGNDFAGAHDDRADGHLALLMGLRRLPQRFAHEIIVAVQVNDRIVHKENIQRSTSNFQRRMKPAQFHQLKLNVGR
jgi:hypothetical protein